MEAFCFLELQPQLLPQQQQLDFQVFLVQASVESKVRRVIGELGEDIILMSLPGLTFIWQIIVRLLHTIPI
jgi:hypothetical protein